MHYLNFEAALPLLIFVGIASSLVASMVGIGGGLVAIPFISLVIGQGHNLEAKLISYASVAVLSLVASIKYIRQKRRPDFKNSFFILLGVLPVTIICEIFLGPILQSKVPHFVFPFCYGVIIIGVMLLINLKEKIPYKGVLPHYSLPFFGAIIGLFAGTFGLSGGVLFVPLLIVGLKMEPKQVAVNSLVLKLVTSLANVFAGLGNHQYQAFESNGVFWWAPLAIVAGAFIGSQIGPFFNKKMSNRGMSISFNVVLGTICVWQFVSGTLLYEGIL